MEFSNTFTVDAPLDTVWDVLNDPQEVTPCVPGAQITEMTDATHFKGTVKVKLGAVQMSYRGEMEMHPDRETRTIALKGKGTEARGSGGASGTVSVRLHSANGGTQVDILSQVDVTGRVATFGRGIMQDVSGRLIQEFASCLERKLAAPETDSTVSTAGLDAPKEVMDVAAQPHGSAVTSSPPPPQPAPVWVESSARAATSNTPANELRLANLLFDILRSRIAAGLRALARTIEPK